MSPLPPTTGRMPIASQIPKGIQSPKKSGSHFFSAVCAALNGKQYHCGRCDSLDPKHGHLNKVAWWAAKFAGEMFPPGSDDSNSAWEWGDLAGLWHDLG